MTKNCETQLSVTYPLILASASPRRQQLLREVGYEFDVVEPPIPELLPASTGNIAAAAWTESLAYFKARAVSEHHPHAVIIGADTVVVHAGTMVGKPCDEADARRILSRMFAGRNEVITGLAVLCPARDRRIITHVTTVLMMRPMDPAELDEYIAGGAWHDKAGAYAIQEGGDKFVQSIEGSFSNIVGLPLEKLAQVLSRIESEIER